MVDLSIALEAAKRKHETAIVCASIEEFEDVIAAVQVQFPSMEIERDLRGDLHKVIRELQSGIPVALSVGAYYRGRLTWGWVSTYRDNSVFGKYEIFEYVDLEQISAQEIQDSEYSLDLLFA